MAAITPGPWLWEGCKLRPADPRPNESAVHTILEQEGGLGFLGSDWRETIAEIDADKFLGIKEGDTPETNQQSALAVQWIDEFMALPIYRAFMGEVAA